MKLSLPLSIATPAALSGCLEELRRYNDAVWESDLAQRSSRLARKTPPKGLSMAATQLLSSVPNPAHPSVDAVTEAIAYLEALQKVAPVIHITTVVELTTESQQNVVQWFRGLVETPSLVRFVTDPQIGGGVIVRTPYHAHDYSYATQLRHQEQQLLTGVKRG